MAPLRRQCWGTLYLKRQTRLPDATATAACADDDEVSRERMIILTLHPP